MPVSFQFLDVASGEPVSLDTADRVACELSGYPFSAKDYCPLYQVATFIGTLSRIQDDSGKVDSAKLRAYLETDNPTAEPERSQIVALLCERFQFSAWYQR
jgi:hypothetical protein